MSFQQIYDGGSDGLQVGKAAATPLAFYGATPVTQRTAAVQATSLLSASTYVTVASNTAAILLEIGNTLQGLGLWKGS